MNDDFENSKIFLKAEIKRLETEQLRDKQCYQMRISLLEKELDKYKNIIEEIKKILDKDQCVEYCYMDVVDYLCEIEGKEKVYDR